MEKPILTWICKRFEELTTAELYQILQLRNEVFIVEQQCPYQDLDGKDQKSYHLMAFDGDVLVAYTRLLPKGISYKGETSIGRVITSPKYRGIGAGMELMENSIAKIYEVFGKGDIKISAQLYLKKFYQKLGFIAISNVYDEDGIPHIEMVKGVN